MRTFVIMVTAAGFLGASAAVAAPIPNAGAPVMSSNDGLIVKAASHGHKNMKRVHKAQGGKKKSY